MNESASMSSSSRPTAHLPAGTDPPDGLRRARGIVTTAWLIATGVQAVVWLVICVTTLSLDAPWWLWTLVGGALVVAALHVAEARRASTAGRQP